MQAPPALENEARRLNRLRQLGVLDTEGEAVLDAFTQLASSITGMPIALISLIDHDRQWFKSAVGLPQGGQTPRSLSFCGHAIAADEVFEVEDARHDPRFSDNPFVVNAPHVTHYAGAPLVMPDGERDSRMGNGSDKHALVLVVEIFARGDPWDAIADGVAEVAHRVMVKDPTIRALVLDVRKISTDYAAMEADRTAGTLSARYEITYVTRSDDLAAQPF